MRSSGMTLMYCLLALLKCVDDLPMAMSDAINYLGNRYGEGPLNC